MNKIIAGLFAATLSIGVLTGVPFIEQIASSDAQARVSKKQANRICRNKYGRKFVRSRISRSGRVICYRRSGVKVPTVLDYSSVIAYCKKRYPFWVSIRAVKRGNKWGCVGKY